MKTKYLISAMLTVLSLLALSMPAHAAKQVSSIELSAKQSYVFKTYLKGDDIKIQSRGGAVTLTGTVAESFHKSLAQETVAGLPGVESVDNRLEVKDSSSVKHSDTSLRDKVKVTLLFHGSVNAGKIKVDVKEGIVTLRGKVDSQTQKELMTENVKDVEGVKGVNNELTVTKSAEKKRKTDEKIDDASVTAQVKITLINHRSTSLLSTTIKTKSGIVTVGGKARNTLEKDLVTKLVADINGVKSVKNQMVIE